MKRTSTVFSVLAIFCIVAASILARSASADPLPDAVSYEYFGFNFADNERTSNTVGTLDYTGQPGCGSICTATTQLGADPSVSVTYSQVTYEFTSGGGAQASLGYYVEYLNAPGTYNVDLHSIDSLSVTDGQTQASAALTFGPAGSNTTSLNNFSSVTLQEASCVNGCPNPGFYPPPSPYLPDQQVQMKANTLYFVQSDLLFAAQPTHVQITGMIDPTFSASSGGQFIFSPGVLSPVPEPATWALMIIGLMVIGAVALRRTSIGQLRDIHHVRTGSPIDYATWPVSGARWSLSSATIVHMSKRSCRA